MRKAKVIPPLHGFPGRSDRAFCGWCSVAHIETDKHTPFDTGYDTDPGPQSIIVPNKIAKFHLS